MPTPGTPLPSSPLVSARVVGGNTERPRKNSCPVLAVTRRCLGATPLLLHELNDALECLESLRHAAHGAMAAAERSRDCWQAHAEEAHSLRQEQLWRPLSAARDGLERRRSGGVALRRGGMGGSAMSGNTGRSDGPTTSAARSEACRCSRTAVAAAAEGGAPPAATAAAALCSASADSRRSRAVLK